MPKDLENMELFPLARGICFFCGMSWVEKPDEKNELPDHIKFGLWEARGFQALHRGGRKSMIKVCNDCLTLMKIAGEDITDAHVEWLQEESKKEAPRTSRIGDYLIEITKPPEPETTDNFKSERADHG